MVPCLGQYQNKLFQTLRVYNTNSPLILYNKSGGVQKLSVAVFCTDGTAEKLTVLDQSNGEPV